MGMVVLLGLIFFLISSGGVSGKECTNSPKQLSSHTARFQLLSSGNESWKEEFQWNHLSDQVEEAMWMGFLPRKLLAKGTPSGEFDWESLEQRVRNSDGDKPDGEGFLKEISLHDVRLDPTSLHGRAQQLNLEYLLMLDVDRLVWSFRKQAGLPANGTPYGGWEGPDVELRGHFVGHYLSATAKMWASTHNATLKGRMAAVVNALSACQKKMGTGYLSAFPTEFFHRFEAIQSVWAPYYTIHKIMAGLLDQYLFAGSKRALGMVVLMADYFAGRVKNVILKYSIERHWLSLNEETGGMNEVLYNLYSVTGDRKHLILAHLFDKPCFLGLLAVKVDSISGFHANTHIPVVIGAQKRYEVEGDSLYKEIGTFFLNIVNSSHCYATGGTSVSEFWSNPKRLADTLQTENEESCTTYNMLKVSRNLFRWTKKMAYADYYERALTNGVLSIQKEGEPGVMIYMLPLGHGVSKSRSYHGWGTPFDSFWCCYGTGIESFSKLGDSIYFEENGETPSLFIIQFISSSLNWKDGAITLDQKVHPIISTDPFMRVALTISSVKLVNQSSTLNLRIPFWSSLVGAKATINGQNLEIPSPGSFLTITRQWAKSDELMLQLPIGLRTETIQDDRPQYASTQAILFGPYALAGLSNGGWNINLGNVKSVSDWVTAVPPRYSSQLASLAQDSGNGTLVLSNSDNSVILDQQPKAGSDSAIHSTFRLVPVNNENYHLPSRIVSGHPVMLEPFDRPGLVLMHKGPESSIAISGSSNSTDSVFIVVEGIDGKPKTISLESENHENCFVSTYTNSTLGKSARLVCLDNVSSGDDALFRRGSSFMVGGGFRDYHPISFIAQGLNRNFVLEPLLSLRDESYNMYFNITS